MNIKSVLQQLQATALIPLHLKEHTAICTPNTANLLQAVALAWHKKSPCQTYHSKTRANRNLLKADKLIIAYPQMNCK